MKVRLPNVKKLFLPDPGFILADCDLAQADAQVVAWEAEDDLLKAIFRDPSADLHDENAKAIFGDCTPAHRSAAKAGVHATNYYAKPPTLARTLGITVKAAHDFQTRWFGAHPKILKWQDEVENSINTKRMVTNKFGNRRFYFERIEGILPQALAWIPQSTVALIINRGLVNIEETLYPHVQNLLQVHDSLVLQITHDFYTSRLLELKAQLEIVVPYEDPLTIPLGLAVSWDSWGDVMARDWPKKAVD